uniref:Beta-mannosidase B n=1 Tax=Candidatus Caldatribacterium californiense TaxID=1454726 RepID=A0A7V3YH06_9BACT
MHRLSLDGSWILEGLPYGEGVEKKAYHPDYTPSDPLEALVPGEVHLDLLRAGRIPEPLFGENARNCQWVEEKEWWYRRKFSVPEEWLTLHAELVFEGIDTDCDVYLNGEHLAHHENMFVPLIIDVSGKLQSENVLVVRVDSGVPRIKDKPFVPYPAGSPEQDYRRVWARKAQFTFAWDWAPRLVNVGIWRSVSLCFFEGFALRDVFVRGNIACDRKSATVTLSGVVENFSRDFACEPRLRLRALLFEEEGKKLVASKDESLRAYPGLTNFTLTLEVAPPRLWWPNGFGEPHLYRVLLLLLDEEGRELDRFEKAWGLREVALRQEPLPGDEGESFILTVNGEPIFCKGADWVPADSLIPRVTREKYQRLIEEAQKAHYNMFRVWGGGIYEDPFFYEHCARCGIMVWQDFMFACAYYPKSPEFLQEVEREIQAVVKQLRNETAIVLWCGNNELQWLHERNKEITGKKDLEFPDYDVYHILMPRLLKDLDPTRPFWPSSPYGGSDPNAEHEGDRHFWDVSILIEDLKERVNYENYARDRGKFISEFGVLAPPVLESLREFIPEEELFLDSPSWQFHNNVFERENIRGMLREFVKDPECLSFPEYLRFAQLLQGEALKFALEHWRRRKFLTAGALFWMYSDCWGAIGWTVIDYYLRKKPSYYFVQRAFQPVDLSLRRGEYAVELFVVNDTPESLALAVEYGLSCFDGREITSGNFLCHIPPNSSRKVGVVPCGAAKERPSEVFFWARLLNGDRVLDWERCFFVRFKDLKLEKARVDWDIVFEKGETFIELVSPVFAWFVNVELPSSFAPEDNYFDLFPGKVRRLNIAGEGELKKQDVKISWNNA